MLVDVYLTYIARVPRGFRIAPILGYGSAEVLSGKIDRKYPISIIEEFLES